jgi:predicted DCC family thiol-disulfide oxidoreductase YuxK
MFLAASIRMRHAPARLLRTAGDSHPNWRDFARQRFDWQVSCCAANALRRRRPVLYPLSHAHVQPVYGAPQPRSTRARPPGYRPGLCRALKGMRRRVRPDPTQIPSALLRERPARLVAVLLGLGALALPTLLGDRRARTVVWDDSCSFCRRWVLLFHRLDALGGLHFVGSSRPEAFAGTGITREAADEAMQLVEPDGVVRSGFDAVRGIVAVLPFGYLVAAVMGWPGIRQSGHHLYRKVAASRTCAYEVGTADS